MNQYVIIPNQHRPSVVVNAAAFDVHLPTMTAVFTDAKGNLTAAFPGFDAVWMQRD